MPKAVSSLNFNFVSWQPWTYFKTLKASCILVVTCSSHLQYDLSVENIVINLLPYTDHSPIAFEAAHQFNWIFINIGYSTVNNLKSLASIFVIIARCCHTCCIIVSFTLPFFTLMHPAQGLHSCHTWVSICMITGPPFVSCSGIHLQYIPPKTSAHALSKILLSHWHSS